MGKVAPRKVLAGQALLPVRASAKIWCRADKNVRPAQQTYSLSAARFARMPANAYDSKLSADQATRL